MNAAAAEMLIEYLLVTDYRALNYEKESTTSKLFSRLNLQTEPQTGVKLHCLGVSLTHL
jgi:hypothetical protein